MKSKTSNPDYNPDNKKSFFKSFIENSILKESKGFGPLYIKNYIIFYEIITKYRTTFIYKIRTNINNIFNDFDICLTYN